MDLPIITVTGFNTLMITVLNVVLIYGTVVCFSLMKAEIWSYRFSEHVSTVFLSFWDKLVLSEFTHFSMQSWIIAPSLCDNVIYIVYLKFMDADCI